jgi:hypothetical protein
MNKIMLKYALAAFAVIHSAFSHSADFAALTLGQMVPDNAINIGQFQLQLPEGKWTVVSTFEARAGSQRGGSAVPTQLTVAVARVDGAKISGLFIFRTPASTFVGVSRWNDDPCGSITDALVKDTMDQNWRMPECFAITTMPPATIASWQTGAGAGVARWLKDSQLSLPEDLLRVYYSKYHGGDFLHANMYLPGSSNNFSAAEVWGRGVAQAIKKMVNRDSPSAAIPALPR